MIALGSDGGQPRADGSSVEAGIHLRWHFDSGLGFPPGGFDVYRRKHEVCGEFKVDPPTILWQSPELDFELEASSRVKKARVCEIDGRSSDGFQLPGRQTLDATLPKAVRSVIVTLDGATEPTPRGRAYRRSSSGDVRVDEAEAVRDPTTNHWTLTLDAESIDHVRIRGRSMRVCGLCIVRNQANLRAGWGRPLNGSTPIHLPITHPDWPGLHSHQPDDLSEAESRLPAALATDVRAGYADGFASDLQGMLYELVGTKVQSRYLIDEAGVSDDSRPDPTRLTWQGLGVLQLMALDPNFARILGLYWHDVPPDPTAYYDYRVVGHWQEALLPATDYFFDDLAVGSRMTTEFSSDDLTVFSPEPLEVVTGNWLGREQKALRSAAIIPGAPIVVVLPEPSPSLAIHLEAEGAVRLETYLGSTRRHDISLSADIHHLLLDDQGDVRKLKLTSSHPLSLIGVVTRRDARRLDDLHYVSFRHRQQAPPEVRVPVLEELHALPGRSGTTDDGEITAGQNAAGLLWQTHQAGGGLDPRAAILFQVRRLERGTGATPTARATQMILLNERNPTLLSASEGAAEYPAGWPEKPLHYVDRDLVDGWYGYQVRGIDLFGRLGDWCPERQLQLLDAVAPPPPVSVSARHLDPDDPRLPAADADHTPGTRVSWEWSGARRLQAPDVEAGGEFRVYFQAGELNSLQGQVVSVIGLIVRDEPGAEFPSQAVLTTDQSRLPSEDSLAGEWLRLGGVYYEIVSSTLADHLKLNVALPDGAEMLPEPGPFTLAFSPGRGDWIDYRDSTRWAERLHVEPADVGIPTIRGSLASVTILPSAERAEVVTDQRLADPNGLLTPGVLVVDGISYQARAHTLGSELSLEVLRHEVPTDPPPARAVRIEPRVGQSFVYYPGRTFTVYLPAQLVPDPDDGTVVGHVAVSTSDNKPHALDQRSDPTVEEPTSSRPGNEGPVSPARKITAVWRERPAAPGNVPVAGPAPIYADPADYYGQARYTLAWEAVSHAVEYGVYRCAGSVLFSRDLDQRRASRGYYAGVGAFDDDPGFVAWLAAEYPRLSAETMTSEAWQAWARRFYPGLSDAEVQALSDRAGNEAAFSRVNARGATGLSHADAFDGRGSGFYLYKVRAIDVAGNPGDWSPTYPPVHVFDVTPPQTPVITSVLGGERSVEITWRANPPDLKEYWLWRAESSAALEDVRRIEPTVVLQPVLDGPLEVYREEGLLGGITHFYRLAAVDLNGNVSAATSVLAARVVDTALPDPPTWRRAQWNAGRRSIELQWRLAEETHRVLVERKSPFQGDNWFSVTGWLAAGATSYADTNVVDHLEYTYRLRVQAFNGNMHADGPGIDVAPLR